ncbi:hypothetical protein ONZ51_g3377 [Trametes cubensis]|uniref:Methyltransferase ausD n=1 Tax=Trametes cubensis TaxID=1111947 RepID=A0AAD7TXX7_9APHY|nr:hypothetical protein ONZ51_g3377 [Trametes cubensis]
MAALASLPDWEHVDDSMANVLPLDEGKYCPDRRQLDFLKAQTGITDEEALKKHVLQVQAEAYAVFPYTCIRRFVFIRSVLPFIPSYERLLKLGKDRETAILLDIGCCFGNDVRCAVSDGFPAKQIVTSDLHAEFWNLGHKLFCSTADTFPARFIPGNVFDPVHLAAHPIIYSSTMLHPIPDLSALTSLNPLRGHVSAIHASNFFHLFHEEQQAHIARALAGLLSPEPGSMILGVHMIATEKGYKAESLESDSGEGVVTMFHHSPESWSELWDGQVFKEGTVEVETNLIYRDMAGESAPFLQWCVTRL